MKKEKEARTNTKKKSGKRILFEKPVSIRQGKNNSYSTSKERGGRKLLEGGPIAIW
jgi:hypothetical protein